MMMMLFVLATMVLTILPLVPALLEWYRPTDAEPLRVIRDYDGSAEHFAVRFREFIRKQLGSAMADASDKRDALVWGRLKDGEKTLLLGENQSFPTDHLSKSREIDTVIAAIGSVVLPQNAFAKNEVYAIGDIRVGDRTACRAVLSEHDVIFGDGCAVLRWAHAEHDVLTGRRARLWGRLTAGHQIALGEGSVFTRLHAPRIITGVAGAPRETVTSAKRTALVRPEDVNFHSTTRWMTKKSLTVPAHTAHEGDLIAEGTISIGRLSHIVGSLKTHRTLVIEPDCVIDGAVIAMQDMILEQGALVAGPVVGEATVTIRAGCVVGSAEHPTTITAPRIRLEQGVVIYGSLWSREDGHVLSDDNARSHEALRASALQTAPAS